jgi:hypothetical protein
MLAHAFLWEYNDKKPELAQLLGQRGVSLTRLEAVAVLGRRVQAVALLGRRGPGPPEG